MLRCAAALAFAAIAVGCGGTSGPEVLGSGEVTLEDVQSAVFTPRCAKSGCHAGTDPQRGLDLSAGAAYDNLVGVPSSERPEFARIEPGYPTESYLYMKISHDPRIFGDPMPADGTTLSDSRVRQIEEWIEQGAPP